MNERKFLNDTSVAEINKVNKNIITIEDPVEYRIDGINQIQINTKIGLSFSKTLRSILRQDPNVIITKTAYTLIKQGYTLFLFFLW